MPAAPVIDAPRVVLVGMMGSGKTEVGRVLADLTGWPFLDNDVLVERASGRTARQLLAERGVDALRVAERAALDAALTTRPPAICAAGGVVVWLRAPAAVLAHRARSAAHRPWLEEDPAAWFTTRLVEREPHYRAVADLEVDTSALDPEGAAAAILRHLAAGPAPTAGPLPSGT
jgi:shikimate kinase